MGVEERAILGHRDDMLVVTKLAAAGEAMKFLGGVGGFGVRQVWGGVSHGRTCGRWELG